MLHPGPNHHHLILGGGESLLPVPCFFHSCPSPAPAPIFYPLAQCSIILRNLSQILSSPVEMFQWLPMDKVLTPVPDPEAPDIP